MESRIYSFSIDYHFSFETIDYNSGHQNKHLNCYLNVDCSLLNYDGRDDHDEDSLSRLGAL